MPHVMLVEQDDSLRRALVRTLQFAGFDVASFGSVDALLAAGDIGHDACLVLDADALGAGGVELKQALDGAGRGLPTIFTTASGSEALAARLAGLAPVAVLHKPFGKDELLGALGRACASPRPEARH